MDYLLAGMVSHKKLAQHMKTRKKPPAPAPATAPAPPDTADAKSEDGDHEEEEEDDAMSIASEKSKGDAPSKTNKKSHNNTKSKRKAHTLEDDVSEEGGSGEDEDENGDESNSKITMPEGRDLTEAFRYLIDFQISKMLPHNLRVPLSDLNITEQQKAELDGTRIALEKNVKKLFSRNLEIETIRDALIELVSKDAQLQELTDPKEQKEKLKEIAAQMREAREPVLKFYPRLLELIQALMAYHVKESHKLAINKTSTASIMISTWMQVLSYLTSIQHVIVYGAENRYFDLKNYPHNIDAITKTVESKKLEILDEITKQTDEIARFQDMLNDKEKKLNAIEGQYQGLLQKNITHGTVLDNLRKQLDAISDPQQIATQNLRYFEAESK